MILSYVEKARIILIFNFIVLFAIVVSTPFFITQGTETIAEEGVEAIFLGIELVAAIFVFRHYDAQMKKREEETMLLNVKLEKKEKELLGALEYLGKVNVQISMIRALFGSMKIPSSKSQLNQIYDELMRIAYSVTKEKGASLRTIDLKTNRTLSEYVKYNKNGNNTHAIGNRDLVKRFEKRDKSDVEDISIFFSDSENFYIKTFIFVPRTSSKDFLPEEKTFLEAIANQCEIMFLLFSSQYYRSLN